MARSLRIICRGAVHVTARGNAQADIYRDDADRQQFLMLLQNTAHRYNWYCHAYCLMDNHYHLLIETSAPIYQKPRRKHRSGILERALYAGSSR